MIPLPGIRDKGAAPLLGARHPGQSGPFGTWTEDGTQDLDQPEPLLHMAQDP